MGVALAEARRVVDEVPVGAAVVLDGRLLAVEGYDWHPAASPTADGITEPMIMLAPPRHACAIALRPLTLSDMYDAAFRIIRFNPKATVGSAVLVASAAMLIPILVTAALTWTMELSLEQSADPTTAEIVGLVGSFGSLGLGTVLQSIGLILVTGMIAHVVAAAAVGRRLSLGEAWAATHGKRWKLIGLASVLFLATFVLVSIYALSWVALVFIPATSTTTTLVLYGVISGPLFVAFLFWFWIRCYYLPVPALMLEQVGVFGAIGRGFALTRKQFWRTFGIALLTVIIAQIASGMLTMPLTLLGQFGAIGLGGAKYAVLVLVLVNALASVISAAFVAPFTTTVAVVQYLDQRIRKEAYDVELMTQAGVGQR